MDEMKEIIDERSVELIIRVIAIGGPVIGLLIGVVVGAVRKQVARSTLNGLAIGSLGILVWIMWVYYSWTVRYDPKSGYVGLHKVSVLLINLLVFSMVGAIVGALWGWTSKRQRQNQTEGGETTT